MVAVRLHRSESWNADPNACGYIAAMKIFANEVSQFLTRARKVVSCIRRSWSSKTIVRELFRRVTVLADVRSGFLHSEIDFSSAKNQPFLLSLAYIVSPSQRIYAVPRVVSRGIECRKRLATGRPLLPELVTWGFSVQMVGCRSTKIFEFGNQ